MNDQINITLPNGTITPFRKGVTPLEIAQTISEGLTRNVLCAKLNGEIKSAFEPIHKDVDLQLLTWNDPEGKSTMWHSSAHLMAEALEALYPGIKLGIGPPIENGFYYDIDFGEHHFDSENLEILEKKILALAKTKAKFNKTDISKAEAIQYFQKKKDEYKLELIKELEDGTISFYKQGNFTDLCKGPHIPHTGFIKAVKILNVAGAYWRGDEKRKQLTRIYAITFPKQKELKEFLTLLEEAKKRDHRKIGKELELFTFSEKVGKGLPLWLPKGAILRERLESFLKKTQTKSGYEPVISPHIGSKHLYVTSGHYDKYGKDSFQPIQTPEDNEEFILKPMNCPHHCEIYASKPRSYKDLPIRFAEFGTVYRYELSGELHGLTRVRGFTQDDAHIFCRPDQVKTEFAKVIDLVLYVFQTLGFKDFVVQISLRDKENTEKYIGNEEDWDRAEKEIKDITIEKGLEFVVKHGEAAFYGPKLDFMIKDALKRSWQLGTIQVDYNLPQRFKLEYTGNDNKKYRPVMIHRAPFGSLERFIAILIENTEGNFPVWLTPEQIAVLPISEKYHKYAKKIYSQLLNEDIRGYIDERDEKIGRKIRDSELKKTPYMIIVGEEEMKNNTVSIRKKGLGDQGSMKINDFIVHFQKKIKIIEK